MSDTTNNKSTKDYLIQERCADILITLQNIASKNYRSAVNMPFYIDKAKEIERTDGITKALSELEDIWKHPRKYKNVIHLLNAIWESSEAVEQRYYE